MKMRRDLVIGVDCSTTACKAIVWDEHGTALAEGRAALSLSMPRSSWHEQDAAQWWSAAAQVLREAAAAVEPQRLAAVCIAHQRETFVPVDEHCRPMRPAIVWMDERARETLPMLDRLVGRERIHAITGKPLSGNLALPKLLWLREREPETLRKAHKIVDVHAFLVYQLTGTFRTSSASADPMGLFDMVHGQWASDLLRVLELDVTRMPEAYPPGAIIGEVTEAAAQLCGLPSGLPVAAGLGDGQAAGLGANITRPGMAYLNLGTAVVSGAYASNYVIDLAFRTMYGGIAGSYSLETVILGGTYTVSWFARQFGAAQGAVAPVSIEDEMEEACRDIAPGCDGLLLVPYWNSAMNPYWDAAASGIVAGWRGIHGRAHLYRAILEGIALEQRLHTEGVERALRRTVDGFVAVGGGARSKLWLQIIADVTGKPVARSLTTEAAALGAGMLAAAAAKLFPDVCSAAQAMAHVDRHVVEPDTRRHDVYSRLYEEVYRHLFPALRPYLDRLTELTQSEGGTVPD